METDRLKLRDHFYRALDLSAMQMHVRQFVQGRLHLPQAGTGSFFTCFQVVSPIQTLCLKIASDIPNPGRIKSWLSDLKKLENSAIALLPPFSAFACYDHLVMVMPFGAPVPEREPFNNEISKMHTDLASVGMRLEDDLLLMNAANVTFLADLSDLYSTPERWAFCPQFKADVKHRLASACR